MPRMDHDGFFIKEIDILPVQEGYGLRHIGYIFSAVWAFLFSIVAFFFSLFFRPSLATSFFFIVDARLSHSSRLKC
jgi:hypothetical protein